MVARRNRCELLDRPASRPHRRDHDAGLADQPWQCPGRIPQRGGRRDLEVNEVQDLSDLAGRIDSLPKLSESVVCSSWVYRWRFCPTPAVGHPIPISANLVDLLDEIRIAFLERFKELEEAPLLHLMNKILDGLEQNGVGDRFL